MFKLIAAAALVPAAYVTTTTLPQMQAPLLPPGQTIGWGPNTGSPVWSQTGLGPSPYQGQPYGAGTPGAPNYPFIQAPSTNYGAYGTTDYVYAMNLQEMQQQANIVNAQLYVQWQNAGGKGPLPQYVGVDQQAFEQWWNGFSGGPGVGQPPPQTFWTGVAGNPNPMVSWIGSPGSYSGAQIWFPQATSSDVTVNTAPANAANLQSMLADLEQAKQLLLEDAAHTNDPAIKQNAADTLAQIAALEKQQ